MGFKPVEIPETDAVIVKMVREKLGVQITENDIDRSHIIGKINNGKAQLICRLRNWKIKNKIYMWKSKLARNPDKTFVTEDLTKYRHLLQLKRDKYHNSFWTSDGRIFTKETETSRKILITSHEEIDGLDPTC